MYVKDQVVVCDSFYTHTRSGWRVTYGGNGHRVCTEDPRRECWNYNQNCPGCTKGILEHYRRYGKMPEGIKIAVRCSMFRGRTAKTGTICGTDREGRPISYDTFLRKISDLATKTAKKMDAVAIVGIKGVGWDIAQIIKNTANIEAYRIAFDEPNSSPKPALNGPATSANVLIVGTSVRAIQNAVIVCDALGAQQIGKFLLYPFIS